MSYTRTNRSKKKKYIINKLKFIRFILVCLIIIGIIFLCVYNMIIKSKEKENLQNTDISNTLQTDNDTVIKAQTPSPSEGISATPTPILQGDILDAINVSDGVKTAYLTFDDGPTSSVTPLILDTLRRYNIKATFFELGSLIQENPDMARRVYEEGHLIANHSYSHKYDSLYATEESFMSEITKTQDLIQNITGEEDYMKLVRFPGGGHNAGSYGASKQIYKKRLEENGFSYCDWNALSKDSEGKSNKQAQELFECAKETINGQEDVVILMHDANNKKTTAESLPLIIEYLMNEGYTFLRLDNKY